MSDTEAPASPFPQLRELPPALRPAISVGEPNEPIPLYAGPLDITQNGQTFRADAAISLAWLPSPRVRFEIPTSPFSNYPGPEELPLSLRLDDGTAISRGLVSRITPSLGPEGWKASLSGIVGEPVVRPPDAEADYVLFLLPNFEMERGRPITYTGRDARAARLVLAAGGWKITLDEAENQKAVRECLKRQSGYGVTYVGRLERDDGKPFKTKGALSILDALAWYTSFACGRWTGPCLPKGFAADGKQVWEAWYYSRTVPYQQRQSWMDTHHMEPLENPFPGFLKLWLDQSWAEVLRVAIHWYIEANAQAGSIEGAIVLTQTAFELLSSFVLVEQERWLAADSCDKLPAADRIRLLFRWAGIPTDIPGELTALVKVAKAYEEFMLDKRPDTAAAMTTIRNTITHPTRKNREKFGKHPDKARTDCWSLGLWNLELCLLRLFDYRGTYGNRLKWRYAGQVETVPWAVHTSG